MKLIPLYLFISLFTLGFASEVEASEQAPSLVFDANQESIANAPQRNSISMELLGRAGLYSFNYDYLLHEDLALGAGISTYSLSAGSLNSSTWIFPVYANYYLNQGKHRFFATGGADLILVSGQTGENSQIKGTGLAGVAGFGYEYKSDDGFLFRAAPYVMIGQASGGWIGFSLGYAI